MRLHTHAELLELLKPYRKAGDKLTLAKLEILLIEARRHKLIPDRQADALEPNCIPGDFPLPLKNHDGVIIDWAIIDLADSYRAIQFTWHIEGKKRKCYVVNNKKERLQIFLMGKAPPGFVIDHIDSNPKNNTRRNLRVASERLNSQNRKKNTTVSSQYLGVCLKDGGWVAACCGKYLGKFKTEHEAAWAYDSFVRKEFKGQGKINNVPKPDLITERRTKTTYPKGIRKANKKFMASFENPIDHQQTDIGLFNTVDDCIEAIQECYEKLPIVRNVDGIAIIEAKSDIDIKDVLVDDGVWHEFIKSKWVINQDGYAQRGIKTDDEYLTERMHLLVLPAEPGLVTDHIYSKLDNRRASLRKNTYGGNNHNKPSTAVSGRKGVTKYAQKYLARIYHEKKYYTLGKYTDIDVAAAAYDAGARQLYGDKAHTNNTPIPYGWEWDAETMRMLDLSLSNSIVFDALSSAEY